MRAVFLVAVLSNAVACESAPRPIARNASLGPAMGERIERVPRLGFWVDVYGGDVASGELLAVHQDAIFVLDEGVQQVQRDEISVIYVVFEDGPDLEIPRAMIDQLYQYARFPQGMPPLWMPGAAASAPEAATPAQR